MKVSTNTINRNTVRILSDGILDQSTSNGEFFIDECGNGSDRILEHISIGDLPTDGYLNDWCYCETAYRYIDTIVLVVHRAEKSCWEWTVLSGSRWTCNGPDVMIGLMCTWSLAILSFDFWFSTGTNIVGWSEVKWSKVKRSEVKWREALIFLRPCGISSISPTSC
jgi:hypothetical protein